jgi:hypothetical protein
VRHSEIYPAMERVLGKHPDAYLVFNIAGRSAIYTKDDCLGYGTRPTPKWMEKCGYRDPAWVDAQKNITSKITGAFFRPVHLLVIQNLNCFGRLNGKE